MGVIYITSFLHSLNQLSLRNILSIKIKTFFGLSFWNKYTVSTALLDLSLRDSLDSHCYYFSAGTYRQVET